MTDSNPKCEKDRLDRVLTYLSCPSNSLDKCPLYKPKEHSVSPPIPLIAHYTEVRQVADKRLSLAETINHATMFVLIVTLIVTAAARTNSLVDYMWVAVVALMLMYLVTAALVSTISSSREGALSIGPYELHHVSAFGNRSIGWGNILNAHRDTVPSRYRKLRRNGKCCIRLDLSDGTTLWLGVQHDLIEVLVGIMRELIRRHHDGPAKPPQMSA